MSDVADRRKALIARLFPGGIPRIWCPLINHYTPDGGIDAFRTRAMIRSLAPHVGGLAVAGEMGDGWVLSRKKCDEVLYTCIPDAKALGMRILYVSLDAEPQDAYGTIVYHLAALERAYQRGDTLENLIAAGLCGYAVTAPVGEHYTDDEIEEALRPILELGAPIALINDPKATGNEIVPITVAKLSREFYNFFLYEDNSGEDKYVLSEYNDDALPLLRGCEGEYSKWFKYYDGFRLPMANALAPALTRVWAQCEDEDEQGAQELSDRLSQAITEMTEITERLMDGDPLYNAVRLVDHFRAYGKDAWEMDIPALPDGREFPVKAVQQVGDLLSDYGLLTENGYLP